MKRRKDGSGELWCVDCGDPLEGWGAVWWMLCRSCSTMTVWVDVIPTDHQGEEGITRYIELH